MELNNIIKENMEQTLEQPVFVDVQGSEQYVVADVHQIAPHLVVDHEIEVGTQEEPSIVNSETIAPSSETQEETGCLIIKTKRFKCPECNRYTAENEEQMLRHIKKVHRGENPFQCYMCDYSTYNKVLFEEHVRIHQGIKPFKCAHCPYKSASKKNAQIHEARHRPDNPLKCTKCPFIARHYRSLVCHRVKLNHGTKCNDCSYVAVDQQDLTSHESTHNSSKFYICSQCNTKFYSLKTLEGHKLSMKKCDRCDMYICTKSLLKRHLITEHNLRIEEVKDHTFVCKICGWGGRSKTRILLHLIHHPAQTVDETVVDVSVLRKLGIMI